MRSVNLRRNYVPFVDYPDRDHCRGWYVTVVVQATEEAVAQKGKCKRIHALPFCLSRRKNMVHNEEMLKGLT